MPLEPWYRVVTLRKVAHLPELRFVLGEPGVETTTVDSAASALEKTGVFLLTKAKAQQLRAKPAEQERQGNETPSTTNPSPGTDTDTETETSAPLPKPSVQENQRRLSG